MWRNLFTLKWLSRSLIVSILFMVCVWVLVGILVGERYWLVKQVDQIAADKIELLEAFDSMLEKQIDIGLEDRRLCERALVAAEKFNQLVLDYGARMRRADKVMENMISLAKTLKEEIKRLKYALENQIVSTTGLEDKLVEKEAEQKLLWGTIHEARSIIYQLRSDMAGLQDQLNQKTQILEVVSNRLRLYEDIEDLLNPEIDLVPRLVPAPELQPVSPEIEETLDTAPPNKVSGRYHLRRRATRFFRQIVTA